MKVIRFKTFSKYDETDRLKKMKDSDILEENFKETPGVSLKEAARNVLTGALVGGTVGKINELTGNKLNLSDTDWKNTLKKGAVAGGIYAIGKDLYRKSAEGDEVDFYNKRLRQAKKNAKRREKSDWINNTLNREGYTY